MVSYLTKKTKWDSFLLKCFSISVICFNETCRTYNYIVFSDANLAVVWATVTLFPHPSVEWGVPGVAVFCPVTLASAEEVCLCAHAHKRGEAPFQLLNSLMVQTCPLTSLTGFPPWTRLTHDHHGPSCPVGSMTSPPFGEAFNSFLPWIFFQRSVHSWKPPSSRPCSLPPPFCHSHMRYSPRWNLILVLLHCIHIYFAVDWPSFMYVVYGDFCVWL